MGNDLLLFQLLTCIKNNEPIPEDLEHTYYEAKYNGVLRYNKKNNTYYISDFGEFIFRELKENFDK